VQLVEQLFVHGLAEIDTGQLGTNGGAQRHRGEPREGALLHPVAEPLQAGRASREARHARQGSTTRPGPAWVVLGRVVYQSPSDGAGSNALRSGASPVTARAAFTP
jgi:hypothetical protein